MIEGPKIKFPTFELKIIFIIVLTLSFYGCKKIEREISITTNNATDISKNSCTVKGTIIDFGEGEISQYGFCYSSSSNPELNNFTEKGGPISSEATFTSSLTGLSASTNYYVRAYATNSVETAYGNEVSFTTSAFPGETGTVTDYDNNTYNTVKIGNQWWMAENLKTTHYANGTEIQLIENTSTWAALGFEVKAMCYYDNSSTNANTYGALYNWAAAMNGANSSYSNPSLVQGVCPAGWHLPSDA
nr:FISUMP domain-containing protein [Bacteroidales bacterium]